ncbi:MAG: response regulator [Xanthobacteraceae bacterium]|nr:response regulator [Xanthobacteraceae bacterium]
MEQVPARSLQQTIETMKVLVVDDEQYMRKVVRTMLLAIGTKTIYEAEDGHAGLEMICRHHPDIVIVDWEMPGIDGATFVRMIRSPQTFPFPDVPIIMLSGHGDRWRVVEAAKLGAHEYLLKPVSTRALHERIAAILTVPRPFIALDNYYGPAPRTLFNRDEGRPASAQKAARPPKDAQPGANRPVAASRTLPARPMANAGSGEVIEKKIVLL